MQGLDKPRVSVLIDVCWNVGTHVIGDVILSLVIVFVDTVTTVLT